MLKSLATVRERLSERPLLGVLAAALLFLLGGSLWYYFGLRAEKHQKFITHRHHPGANGGIIISVGSEHYHIEALFTPGGVISLFTLGQDQSRVMTVPVQTLTAYVRPADSLESTMVTLEPVRSEGDPEGQTSAFEGKIPLELSGRQLMVIVPQIAMGSGRYRFGFMAQAGDDAEMPKKVTNEAERELYLTAAGKYTEADIKANGSMTASQKYKGFRSDHSIHPAKGERICPVTQTKANAQCTWIIDGKVHEFCCPPCIDEFVKMAKERPDEIQDPTTYVQP